MKSGPSSKISVTQRSIRTTKARVWSGTSAKPSLPQQRCSNFARTPDGITTDNQFTAKFNTGPIQYTALFGVDYQWRHPFKQDRDSGGSASARYCKSSLLPKDPDSQSLQRLTQERGPGRSLRAEPDEIRQPRVLLLGGREDFANSSSVDTLRKTNQTQSGRCFHRPGRRSLPLPRMEWRPMSAIRIFLADRWHRFFWKSVRSNPRRASNMKVGSNSSRSDTIVSLRLRRFDLTQQNLTTADTAHPTFSVQTGEVHMSVA